ncbi:hypothetical protein ACS0TY_009380 [Phlomoides rotata]
MHNTIEQESDELEETLSLCDLPLYSDQSADFDQDFSSSQQDYNFEFFSQELNPSSTITDAAAPENIIFCGKLIPYKQPPQTNIKIQTINKRKSYWPFFRWNVPEASKKGTTEKMYNTNKRGKGQDKVCVFTNSPSGKGKWYFLMFGISRFSPVVELRDIKNRQRSRRRKAAPPLPVFGWGLWELIRALSCGGNHQPTAGV